MTGSRRRSIKMIVVFKTWINKTFLKLLYLYKRRLFDVCIQTKENCLVVLSCQPGMTMASCSVYKVIRNLESIYYLCIYPIHRIGLIHK